MTNQPHVLGLRDVDRTQIAIVGGKGASLGEMSRIEGIRVPDGFCVTTHAFRRFMASIPAIQAKLDRLARARRDELRALSAEIRDVIEAATIPDDVATSITQRLEDVPYAVRSSATAEDSEAASFAGQHDTYLNITGASAILAHVRRCWASLFTERAVMYRLQDSGGEMAVVVQQMVSPRAAGILFTAHPISGNRKVTSIDAAPGLGEALVSGLVNPDVFEVRGDTVVAKKTVAADAVLTDAQAVRLARLGRRIEAHFGAPQDIEWCIAGDEFSFVQSRPITTLFPIPRAADGENHVYVSVGHQQMMTDPFKPLGLSVWQLITPRPMAEAGGRLFVDVTKLLASPGSRATFLDAMGKSDVLIRDALETILGRGDFIPEAPDNGPAWLPPGTRPAAPIETDANVCAEMIAKSEASIAKLKVDIATKAGPELLDFIKADIASLRGVTFDPRSLQVILSAMEATWWLNDHLQEWLGEKNVADAFAQSVPHNVTSEMGLALLEVADVIRPCPEVVAYLQDVETDDFLDGMSALAGGPEARRAIQAYLEKYGMRCSGEIDITRPRWSEQPSALVPMILGNVKTFTPGAGARRFEEGKQQALEKEIDVLARVRALVPQKAQETKQRIDCIRAFMGYREYPKFALVSRTFVYKQALMKEADRLVQARVLREREDLFYLRLEEIYDVMRSQRVDDELVRGRREAFHSYESLTPPRVMTSDGEGVNGTYRRDDLPPGALVGLPVSAGTVEGRARVVLDMADADLEPGDILVTAFTDPSWTPLFVAIKGLVAEVGGLMTHGSVIAREYGLPAVVGVANATRLIRDGQRIRVHGAEGYVEIIE